MNKRFGLSARDSINDLGFTALAYVPRSINKIVIRYKGETIYEKEVAPVNKVLSVRAPTQWLNDEAVTVSCNASKDINLVKPEFRIVFSKDKETWYELATGSSALLPSGQAGRMDISLRSPLTDMRDDIPTNLLWDDSCNDVCT